MKKSFLIVVFLLFSVNVALASYPVNYSYVLLANGVTASTEVSLMEGMQIGTITFQGADGSEMGTVTLSPVQPTATNLEYRVGSQTLQISNISFQAAFGLQQGEVTCAGSATDQNGNNNAPFQKQIASWSNM